MKNQTNKKVEQTESEMFSMTPSDKTQKVLHEARGMKNGTKQTINTETMFRFSLLLSPLLI